MTKTYASISDMLDESAIDESLREEVKDRIASRHVIRELIALRVSHNKSQKDIADKLGCSQSRISKLENGTDADLRIGDFHGYLSALDCDLKLVISDRADTLADEVKYHAFSIKLLTDKMAQCAAEDESIAKGVSGFIGEAFFNLISMLHDSARKLPKRPGGESYIKIEMQHSPSHTDSPPSPRSSDAASAPC